MDRMRKTGICLFSVLTAVALVLANAVSVQTGETAKTTPSNSLSTSPFAKQLSNAFLVIGHRGNPAEAPENTLASINAAFSLGIGMVEIDVHLSRDGVPVVIHDDTVDRTTNGKGLVSRMTVAQLKRLDAGSWKDPKYAGERIPTLAEALGAAKGRGLLLLDLKVDGMGRKIAEVLHRLGHPESSVAIGTWDAGQTRDMAVHLPRARILMTVDNPITKWEPQFFKKQIARGVTGFELSRGSSAEFAAAAHMHRLPVYAYTIDDERVMREMIDLGMDGIETNVPRVLLRLVKELTK
jgi:glycerophosphoryl diester phosphodiesterase